MNFIEKLDLVYNIQDMLNDKILKRYILNILIIDEYNIKVIHDDVSSKVLVDLKGGASGYMRDTYIHDTGKKLNRYLPYTRLLKSIIEKMKEKNITDYDVITVYRRMTGSERDVFNFKVRYDRLNHLKVYNLVYKF